MKDFFVSYNRADRHWAEWVAWQLEEAGHRVVIQAWDFRPGENFVLNMHRAAEECERTIALLSPNYLQSMYTQPEWAAAFSNDPTGEKGLLLPVRVRECEPAGLLRAVAYIDLVGLEEAQAREVLCEGLERKRAKPAVAPQFPAASLAMPHRTIQQCPRFPGALPAIWNVPHNRNRNFAGRDDLLDRLHDELIDRNAVAVSQAITGLGGVGKTQIAIEYAYRYASEYDLVWWIMAEHDEALKSGYVALAPKLRLEESRNLDEVVFAVREWLGQNGRWLLVFDNAREPQHVRSFLPQGHTGHVLVTSRNPQWRSLSGLVRVEVWEPQQAIEFLKRRTGLDDPLTADALARALGYLPLALEQAAAYIEAKGTSLAEYLTRFNKHELRLLEAGQAGTDYPATVATTWGLSFEETERASPAAAQLLNLCAFLAPDRIPLWLFTACATLLPEPLAKAAMDDLELDEAVGVLRRYSFVGRAGQGLSLHRLMQAVSRERLGDNKAAAVKLAVELVWSAFPADPEEPGLWTLCGELLPHAVAAGGYAEAYGIAREEAGQLFAAGANYLKWRAQYTDARVLLDRALRMTEAAVGATHIQAAPILGSLGLVLRELGDFPGAKTCFEKALGIAERAYGSKPVELLPYLNNSGLILSQLGDAAGAKRSLERALRIAEADVGLEDSSLPVLIHNLAIACWDLGQCEEARSLLERALRIAETTFGPAHLKVALTLERLGLYLTSEKLIPGDDLISTQARGEEYLLRALDIFKSTLGEEHPYTKRTAAAVSKLQPPS